MTESTNDCENESDPDQCYWDLAYETSDASLCTRIKNAETKNYCYYDIAFDVESYDLCNPISDDALRDECYMDVLINKESKDAAVCERMKTELKQECLEEVATGS